MALLDSEVARLKYELGYNVLTINSEPRIDHVAIFEQVIQPYMQGGASTTSATTVTAGGTTPVTLTLASATGFAAGAVVVVDVGSRQERAAVQSLSGATISLLLANAHSGTFPVTVEGGETMVRELLNRLRALADELGEAFSSAGLKSVGRGAVEWYGDSGTSVISSLKRLQSHLRNELASLLGIQNLHQSGASTVSSLY